MFLLMILGFIFLLFFISLALAFFVEIVAQLLSVIEHVDSRSVSLLAVVLATVPLMLKVAAIRWIPERASAAFPKDVPRTVDDRYRRTVPGPRNPTQRQS